MYKVFLQYNCGVKKSLYVAIVSFGLLNFLCSRKKINIGT